MNRDVLKKEYGCLQVQLQNCITQYQWAVINGYSRKELDRLDRLEKKIRAKMTKIERRLSANGA